MLWRLVLRMLFKACLPLVALVGVMSYGVYLRGGDPGALWQGAVQAGGDRFSRLIAGVRQDASQAVSALTESTGRPEAPVEAAGKTAVYTWQDADGVAHFSSHKPAGIDAGTMLIDPNVNVLAPVKAPLEQHAEVVQEVPDRRHATLDRSSASPAERTLPGVAGQVLGAQQPAAARRSGSETASPGVDPSQLLRLLQQVER